MLCTTRLKWSDVETWGLLCFNTFAPIIYHQSLRGWKFDLEKGQSRWAGRNGFNSPETKAESHSKAQKVFLCWGHHTCWLSYNWGLSWDEPKQNKKEEDWIEALRLNIWVHWPKRICLSQKDDMFVRKYLSPFIMSIPHYVWLCWLHEICMTLVSVRALDNRTKKDC
jgi:hypothetical protein